MLLGLGLRLRRRSVRGSTVVDVVAASRRSRSRGRALRAATLVIVAVVVIVAVDDDVAHVTALVVLRQGLVVKVGLGVLRDDVPGVEETGDEAEDAEEDVDDGVAAADASLYPDCWNWRACVSMTQIDREGRLWKSGQVRGRARGSRSERTR